MEYMYDAYNYNTASYEPRHEKICLRGESQGRRHKMVCMATEASWRLEFGIKKRVYVTSTSHLHNKRIKTTNYMECTVYKRTETFRGVRLQLSAIAVCISSVVMLGIIPTCTAQCNKLAWRNGKAYALHVRLRSSARANYTLHFSSLSRTNCNNCLL